MLNCRLKKGKELRKAEDLKEVKQNMHIIRAPAGAYFTDLRFTREEFLKTKLLSNFVHVVYDLQAIDYMFECGIINFISVIIIIIITDIIKSAVSMFDAMSYIIHFLNLSDFIIKYVYILLPRCM